MPSRENPSGPRPGPVARWIALGPLAVAAGAVVWIWREHGSFIAVGAVVGALIVTHFSLAAPAARPFASLAETARPLVLPLLVAVAVGTFKFSPVVQVLVVGAVLVVAWRLVVVPEAAR